MCTDSKLLDCLSLWVCQENIFNPSQLCACMHPLREKRLRNPCYGVHAMGQGA